MSILTLIRNTKTGSDILDDWLGAGAIPVLADKSSSRAGVCVNCDQNQRGSWWEMATSPIAEAIRRQIALKAEIEISTPHDNGLGTCAVCSCNLPLKCHVPIEHIRKNTTPEQLKQFPAHCWILKEISA